LFFQSTVRTEGRKGKGPGGVVDKDVSLFDGEIIAPVGYFDVSFQLFDIGNGCSIFVMDFNFLERGSR
jgi:hypothetical protein